MTDKELIEMLRNNVGVSEAACRAANEAAARIEALIAERDDYASILKNSSIVEIASRNNRVTEYMFHWEGRALEAEAKLAKIEAETTWINSVSEQYVRASNDGHRRIAEYQHKRIGELETKLTKAVKALEFYAYSHAVPPTWQHAHSTLAEIKGESHE